MMHARPWRKRVLSALAPLALAGVACGVVQVRRAARLASITRAAEAASHPLIFECRWERPVVGGVARDCNGVDVAGAAVERLFADAPEGMMAKASLLAALEQDRPLPGEVSDFVASHREALAEVREAARCSWACVRDSPRTHYRRGSVDTATDLLLFTARGSAPETCLSIAIDVMRLVQDGETGLVSAFASREGGREPRQLHEARRTLLECGRRASGPLLADAAGGSAIIATTPPPVGHALATDALVIATALLDDVGQPDRPGAENVLWVQRGGLLDVADALVARIDTFRGYRDDDLPAVSTSSRATCRRGRGCRSRTTSRPGIPPRSARCSTWCLRISATCCERTPTSIATSGRPPSRSRRFATG
jgi:hypothetical protein